ncbi:uncharacterized protein LOC102561618 isoform X1 [Alligator mississippiensis]|uniref:uncharacterized protein LOC102561618 isoform X1 n=1 Tax=Alligator mississippiensis TaxID=8496 RepID=UPI0006EC504F|nr:uncharacterized protein LOC102561618 isoform X1 [Alligator mississippiensis]
MADGARGVRGRGAPGREKPNEFLSDTQKATTTHHLSLQELQKSWTQPRDWEGSSLFKGEIETRFSPYTRESPTIDDLEESLRQLKVQVDSLASSLSFDTDQDYTLDSGTADGSSPFNPKWPMIHNGTYTKADTGDTLKQPDESEWFLKPTHLVRPLGDYPALTSLGLPMFSTSAVSRVAGLLGSEIASRNCLPSVDLASAEPFPAKLGAPHVIGVKALLSPKIPVRARSPERVTSPLDRGRSLSFDRLRTNRSHSFSPASKRTRWLRSRSQSPRPIWRPNSAKANACAQPAPHFSRSRGSRKKTAATRQSRSRIYKPGALAARSCTPGRMPTKALSSSWSPYSLSSAAIASPTAQEINERFLQTLAEGAVGRSLIEMSPYEKELARLRLERLRMEEEWLLELKRQQELERTRGPKPKWYEMKSSQFHYEAHKNNQLLRSSQDLQSMYNYRRELESASKEFQEHSKPTHLASL